MTATKSNFRTEYELELFNYFKSRVRIAVQSLGGLHELVNGQMLIADMEWLGTEAGVIHDRQVQFERLLYCKYFFVQFAELVLNESFQPRWNFLAYFKKSRRKLPWYPSAAAIEFDEHTFKVVAFDFVDRSGNAIKVAKDDQNWQVFLQELQGENSFGLLKR